MGLARAGCAGGRCGHGRRPLARGRSLSRPAHGGRVAAGGCVAVIPLRDNVSSRSVPVVTLVIIALNMLVYLYELSLGASGGAPKGGRGGRGGVPLRRRAG